MPYLKRVLPVLLALTLPAAADQVLLKNGDRVTGKIVKKDGAKVTIKSDIFGPVEIPWDAVTEVTSDEDLVVVLPDAKEVRGKISTEGGKVAVKTETATESAPVAEVTAIRNADEQKAYERLQHPGPLNLWGGYFDIGAALARGNAKTDNVTTALKAERTTRTDKTSLYFNQIYARSTANGVTATTAQAIRGGWSYNRNLTPKLFVNLFNDYEADRFQNLDLRFVLGGGLGYALVKNEKAQLDLLGGASYNRESFNTGLLRNSAEVYWGNDFTYKLTSLSALKQSFRMFNNMTTTGEYRINFDFGAVTNIRKWLAWQITFSDRYLSNPLPGKLNNDILLSTGLRFTFTRN